MTQNSPLWSTRYSSTLDGRLQVKPSRYYRYAWLMLGLLQAWASLSLLNRLPPALLIPVVVTQVVLLLAVIDTPQQGDIIRWRDGRWWLWQGGQWRGASLGPTIVLFPWVTAFTLRCGRDRHFLLFNDAADRADLHRLRLQLNLLRSGKR